MTIFVFLCCTCPPSCLTDIPRPPLHICPPFSSHLVFLLFPFSIGMVFWFVVFVCAMLSQIMFSTIYSLGIYICTYVDSLFLDMFSNFIQSDSWVATKLLNSSWGYVSSSPVSLHSLLTSLYTKSFVVFQLIPWWLAWLFVEKLEFLTFLVYLWDLLPLLVGLAVFFSLGDLSLCPQYYLRYQ